jgi:hypothetical protein
MLIDQQQWDMQREARNQETMLQSAMLEERAKDAALQRENIKLGMEAQRYQNALMQQKAQQLQEFQTPKETSLYGVIGDDFAQTEQGRSDMLKLFAEHGEDLQFSQADGTIRDANNKIIPISGQEFAGKLSMMDYINRAHRNMPEKVLERKLQLQEELSLANAEIKSYGKNTSGRFNNQLQNAMRRKSDAEAGLKRAAIALSAEGLSSFYGREAEDFENAAAYFGQFGMAATDQTQWLQAQGNKFRDLQNKYMQSMVKSASKTDNAKIYYFVDPNTKKTVGQAIGTTNNIPTPPKGSIVTTSPGYGKGGEEQVRQSMTLANAESSIHRGYKVASDGIAGDVTAADLADKINTHTVILNLFHKSGDPTSPDRVAESKLYSTLIVDQQEAMYDGFHSFYLDPYEDDASFHTALKGWAAEEKDGKPVHKAARTFMAGVANNKIKLKPEGIKATFKDWYLKKWKAAFARRVKEYTGETLPPASIYEPNEFTRQMKNLSKTLGTNR